MIFFLSKIFWMAAQPGNLLCLVLAAGVLWFWASGRRHGIALVVVATAGFAAIIVLPLGEWAIAPLEARFPPPRPLPAKIDGIILLGGAVDVDVTLAHGQVALDDAAERITATVALARRYPAVPIVVAGGNGELTPHALSEAAATALLLTEDGVDVHRLRLEEHSHTTYGNAVDAKALVEPRPGEIWLLVTSAAHMPRAVGCFRAVGWTVTPYPVDYRTGRPFLSRLALAPDLRLLDVAVHEWIGLAAYRLLGRIDQVFPAPQDEGPRSAISAR